MPVEIFNRRQFEDALPSAKDGQRLWVHLGLIGGEHCYSIAINPYSEVFVRSSVHGDGVSAECGKDSIRLWLARPVTHRPLAKKLSRWIARTGDWRGRLLDQARTLYKMGQKIPSCKCNKPAGIREVRKEGPNKGKPFAACNSNNCNFFQWIDE